MSACAAPNSRDLTLRSDRTLGRTTGTQPVSNLPLSLAKTGYKEPKDAKPTNYADCCPEGLGLFDKCVTEPAYQDSFSGYMTSRARYKVPWPKFYDTSSLVNGSDLSNGSILCVDIGGHHGTDLARLLDKHPGIPDGSLVLQDLPEVLAGVTSMSEKIKAMPHDMFQPQPLKGMTLRDVDYLI